MYCGFELGGPLGEGEAPELPDDLDQLVRQAMSLGTTAHLEKALNAAAEAGPSLGSQSQAGHERVTDGSEVKRSGGIDSPVGQTMSRREALEALHGRISDALAAETRGDEASLRAALIESRDLFDRIPSVSDDPPLRVQAGSAPVVLLPKVRREYALVVQGVGDVEAHQVYIEHLGLDGVTARMMARARQPRVAVRDDSRPVLEAKAMRLKAHSQVLAEVVTADQLRSFGPAHLLTSFERGPQAAPVLDWSLDMAPAFDESGLTPVTEMPGLVVPGELVFQRYKPGSGKGRLRHLKEGRMETGRQTRLQVADLHFSDRIVRILEGTSDLSHAPGASEEGFVRTLSGMLAVWEEQDSLILDGRILEPIGADGRMEESGAIVAHPWPQWEEHSRISRCLYLRTQ